MERSYSGVVINRDSTAGVNIIDIQNNSWWKRLILT